jgi:hypothetical protein
MVLKIEDEKFGESVFIESNFVDTCSHSGTSVRAVFDGSDEKFLQMVVTIIFGFVSDILDDHWPNINTKDTVIPKPDGCGNYAFFTKFGGVYIEPLGDDGMYELTIEDLSHEDCSFEVYVNDRKVG